MRTFELAELGRKLWTARLKSEQPDLDERECERRFWRDVRRRKDEAARKAVLEE
jgi:hypothetical protein